MDSMYSIRQRYAIFTNRLFSVKKGEYFASPTTDRLEWVDCPISSSEPWVIWRKTEDKPFEYWFVAQVEGIKNSQILAEFLASQFNSGANNLI